MDSIFAVEDVGRGLDYVAQHDSAADYYSYPAATQHVFTAFVRPSGGEGLAPYVRPFRPSRPIGPTDQAATLPFGTGLVNRLQVIDKWTPRTEWGGGLLRYGVGPNGEKGGYSGTRQGTFPTKWWQDRPPLELPRYNYAAMDTQALYDQARERVSALQELLSGGR